MAKRAKTVRLKWELHTIVGSALVAKKLCDLLVEEGLGRFVGNRFEFYHSNLSNQRSEDKRMNSTLTKPLQQYLNILIKEGAVFESDYSPKPESLVKLVQNAAGCSLDRLPNDRRFKEEWFAKKTSKDISFPLSGAKEGKLMSDVFQALGCIEESGKGEQSTIGIINGSSIFNLLIGDKYLLSNFRNFLKKSSNSWIIVIQDTIPSTQSSELPPNDDFNNKKRFEQVEFAESIRNDINLHNRRSGKLSRIKVFVENSSFREGLFLGYWCATLYAPVGTVFPEPSFFYLHDFEKLSLQERKCIYLLRNKFIGGNAAKRI